MFILPPAVSTDTSNVITDNAIEFDANIIESHNLTLVNNTGTASCSIGIALGHRLCAACVSLTRRRPLQWQFMKLT